MTDNMSSSTQLNLADFKDIPLKDDTGKDVTLADFVGKRVLIFFFPKADTPGCTTQACGFRDAWPRIKEANGVVLGMSGDTPEELAKWKKKENLPYTLISDVGHKALEKFGVWGEKSMYGKTYLGIIRSHFVFDENGQMTESHVKISPADSIEMGVKSLVGA